MARAFDKLCAPGNDEIGPYDFIDDCNWPSPPDPITPPTDPPIPIPPVDQGCFPFNITGELFVPGDSSAVPGGFDASVIYPNDDYCEPEIDLKIDIPCFVGFSAGAGTVVYNTDVSEATLELDVTGGDICDFVINLDLTLPCPTIITGGTGEITYDISLSEATIEIDVSAVPDTCDYVINLSLGLPCPTAITGGTGTVDYSPDYPGGSVGINVSALPDSCDYEIGLDLTLPCPGEITAQTTLSPETSCLPRQPSIGVTVTNVYDSSAQQETCDYNLDFQLNLPCPIVFGSPTTIITTPNVFGSPTGKLSILTAATSSSVICPADCEPDFQLNLSLPCPVDFNNFIGSWAFHEDDEGTPQPWATTPTAAFTMDYTGGEVCQPVLSVSLNLPCPVRVDAEADGLVTFEDSAFYADGAGLPTEPPVTVPRTRQWAFGQPTGRVTVSLDSVGSDPTECLPILDVSLNLPCPTGGLHKVPSDDVENALMSGRQTQYYAVDTNNPYYSLIPAGSMDFGFGRSIMPYDDLLGMNPDDSVYPRGHFGRAEFDDNCNLNLDLSLWLPCSHRELTVEFLDIDTGSVLCSADGWSIDVHQDWANQGENPHAFDDLIQLHVTPGGGGGPDSKFAKITSFAGTEPPFLYYGYEIEWNEVTEDWDAVAEGKNWGVDPPLPLRNLAEMGDAGSGARNIPVDSMVVPWEATTNQWFFNRLHYRGTYN